MLKRGRERKRERERGEWEGYVQHCALKGSGPPLDNRGRDKMNREWQRHQERSGKIALTRRFIAVHVYVKTSWLSFALKQSKIARVWKFWERKHRWQIIAFNAGRTPIPNSRGSVIWCRDYGAEKKPSGKSLSSVWGISDVAVKMGENISKFNVGRWKIICRREAFSWVKAEK